MKQIESDDFERVKNMVICGKTNDFVGMLERNDIPFLLISQHVTKKSKDPEIQYRMAKAFREYPEVYEIFKEAETTFQRNNG